MEPSRARRIVECQWVGVLLPDIILPFDDTQFDGSTVADVMADPGRFEGATLADLLKASITADARLVLCATETEHCGFR